MINYNWRQMAADERRRAASYPPGSPQEQEHLTRAAEWESLADIERGLLSGDGEG